MGGDLWGSLRDPGPACPCPGLFSCPQGVGVPPGVFPPQELLTERFLWQMELCSSRDTFGVEATIVSAICSRGGTGQFPMDRGGGYSHCCPCPITEPRGFTQLLKGSGSWYLLRNTAKRPSRAIILSQPCLGYSFVLLFKKLPSVTH